MTTEWLLTIILLIALVAFSLWCFIKNFRGNWVCTTKDLITTFVSGGALAVVVMVFGVSTDIKGETAQIYQAVSGQVPVPEAAATLPADAAAPSPAPAPGQARLGMVDLDRLESLVARLEGVVATSAAREGQSFGPDDRRQMALILNQLQGQGEMLRVNTETLTRLARRLDVS